MRRLTVVSVAMVMAIASYFVLVWGFDALRMLASPTYGLEDVWRSQFIFEIGRLFDLAPLGLIKLAAFFATLKLAVAGICAVHVATRLRSLAGTKVENEIFESALMLVVLVSIASIGPAIWSDNSELVSEQAIQLMLACVAAGLGMLERHYACVAKPATADVALKLAATPRGAPWFSPFR